MTKVAKHTSEKDVVTYTTPVVTSTETYEPESEETSNSEDAYEYIEVTPTPEPTVEPTPTPEPTAEPTPEPTPTPTPTPTPEIIITPDSAGTRPHPGSRKCLLTPTETDGGSNGGRNAQPGRPKTHKNKGKCMLFALAFSLYFFISLCFMLLPAGSAAGAGSRRPHIC